MVGSAIGSWRILRNRGSGRWAALALVVALVWAPSGSAELPARAAEERPSHVLRYRAAYLARLGRMAGHRATAAAAVAGPILEGFTVVGHADLGATDVNGDVWVHGDHAYVGTWSQPCTGLGVKIVDVSDPSSPVVRGRVAGMPGTSAEDVVVRHVSTPWFTGDLLAAGIQRCDYSTTELDDDTFGVDLWDVTDPSAPVHLAHLGLTVGGGGVHELDLIDRGRRAYVVAATPWSEWFDPSGAGDVRIVDVSDPRVPRQVADWGAGEQGLAPGPFWGRGSFPATFAHSARFDATGRIAYVSYWDLGVVTLDLTDVARPIPIGRTIYPFRAEGDAHSVVPFSAGGRSLLLQNDEDWEPRSPPVVRIPGLPRVVGAESRSAPALFLAPDHRIAGRVVRPRNEGCRAEDYGARGTLGAIAVVRTYPPTFADPQAPPAACDQRRQDRVAERLGAVAVVHDVRSRTASPAEWEATDVGIPVVFVEHDAARAMVEVGRAELIAPEPSWGFLRVFDAATGAQLATFGALPQVHRLRTGCLDLTRSTGCFSIHNTEVMGDRAYASWYSNGLVALDLSPLAGSSPGPPTVVGRFVPEGGASPTPWLPGGVPLVWGVFARSSDGLVFASDMLTGLWILRPEGGAAPSTRVPGP
ncbi:MAG: hypothetical protein KatS3mg014_0326 [Actinomycetota bacterium]|nr:MAG: hypothetical protein KatS3mg014_0326 [Actinomycetota bacterium]